MSQVVKRRRQSLVIDCAGDLQPVETHRSEHMIVESQLSWGIEPKVQLTWKIEPDRWKRGFKLMVFRSTTGFCPDERPEDLNLHGSLIIEKRHDGSSEEHLAEGTYFYTFVLSKRHWHGLTRSTDILRFSVNIPSAKVAIGRIQDQRTLRELAQVEVLAPIQFHADIYAKKALRTEKRRAFKKLRHRPESTPAKSGNKVIEQTMNKIDEVFEAFLATGRKIEEVKKDPRFAQLSKAERKQFFERIEYLIDPAELIARGEQS